MSNDTDMERETTVSSASEHDLEADFFQFPEEGSYLHEAINGKRTPLMNEGLDQDDDSNDVPLRILNDFVIFDPRTLHLVSLSCLSDGAGFCEAFGWALAESDDVDDDDDRDSIQEDGILLRVSNILKWSLDIHEESLLILTEYAWYILRAPSHHYKKYFIPFYQKETLFRVVLRNVITKPAMTLRELLHLLSLPDAKDNVLDRCWTRADLLSHFQYSRSTLQDLVSDVPGINWDDIKNAPLLEALLRECSTFSNNLNDLQRVTKPQSRRTSDRINKPPLTAQPCKRKTNNVKRFPTTLTPTVYSLISPFLEAKFNVAGQKPAFLTDAAFSREEPHNEDSAGDELTGSLNPGDFVIVNEGNHWDTSQQRYAQIVFLDRRGKKFHARWFIHGSQTILEELAFGQELFLLVSDNCRDVSVDCVVRKCRVMRISLNQRSTLNWPAKHMYFYSSAWDKNNPVDFIEVKDEQVQIPTSRFCKACDSRKSPRSDFISSFSSIINTQNLHQHDFIRYQNTDDEQITCSFGQIITFHSGPGGNPRVTVRRLGRVSDRKENLLCVEHELFLTPIEEIVNTKRVLGPCHVSHISRVEDCLTDPNWLDRHPLRFYVQYQARSLTSPLVPLPLTSFYTCGSCQQKQAALDRLDVQIRGEKSLRAFDPFVGVGGFGLGLSQGCSMHTTYGVELNTSAAKTMKRNFPPETIVLNKDANEVLIDVVEGRAGVPRQGEVDLIYTGPPCQNDSALNRHKNDRKWLAFTALSFLDVLHPSFFIMESVPGFLQWKLMKGTEHEIKAGDLKLVLRVLHFLGYNVMGRLLHARSYGDPQTRNRFFLVATLPECGDFVFPEATHTFKPGQPARTRETLGHDLKVKVAVCQAGSALHEVVTVAEALSDLPLFDWTRPTGKHNDDVAVISPTFTPVVGACAEHIPTVPCDIDGQWGIHNSAFRYTLPPMNEYQRRLRWDLGLADPQYQHFTKHFVPDTVRNVCDVPLTRGADYRHLIQHNREWLLRDPASAKAMDGYQAGAYTRLDPDGYFHTIVTHVAPVAKQSAVLHPFCKRILTVREMARAQGFPDVFTFYSEADKITDYHKQIGNSVPFRMSAALGRSIQEVVFRQWIKNRDGRYRE